MTCSASPQRSHSPRVSESGYATAGPSCRRPAFTSSTPSTVSAVPGRNGTTPDTTWFEPPAQSLAPRARVTMPAGIHAASVLPLGLVTWD